MELCLQLELAYLENTRLSGLAIDFAKFFDRVPRQEIILPSSRRWPATVAS